MAKILGDFTAIYTRIWSRFLSSMGTSTNSVVWLTFLVSESKLIVSQNKGGVTMESGTSGSIPGRSSLRAMVRP